MSPLEEIRLEVIRLYKYHPQIHVDVNMVHPKIVLKNVSATITSVFPHIFQIEAENDGVKKSYTLQYTDLLIRRIVILELERQGTE